MGYALTLIDVEEMEKKQNFEGEMKLSFERLRVLIWLAASEKQQRQQDMMKMIVEIRHFNVTTRSCTNKKEQQVLMKQ